MSEIPEGTPCARKCGRPATQQVADDATAAVHGWFAMVCEQCYLEGAIRICEDHAGRLPELKRRLALLTF